MRMQIWLITNAELLIIGADARLLMPMSNYWNANQIKSSRSCKPNQAECELNWKSNRTNQN